MAELEAKILCLREELTGLKSQCSSLDRERDELLGELKRAQTRNFEETREIEELQNELQEQKSRLEDTTKVGIFTQKRMVFWKLSAVKLGRLFFRAPRSTICVYQNRASSRIVAPCLS